MARAKKSEEDKKVDLEKPVEKPAPKKAVAKPAPKKAVAAVKKPDPVVIKLGQRVRHVKKSHIEGEVVSVRNSEEGFTIKVTVLCNDGHTCALSAKEAVVI